MNEQPPPLPRLVLPSDEPSCSPDLIASFEASHPKKPFHEIRSSLRGNSASNHPPSSESPTTGSDGASEHGSVTFRDRLMGRLSRSRSNDNDSLNESASVIMLQDSRSADDVERDEAEKDRYRWAVMIENQRGISIFGLSQYSATSLLPNDPPPFTIPPEHAHDSGTSTTPHNLRDYQLPDASWVWVSNSWLVQMGGNGSSVDGYEYNWWFRQKGWRASPGIFSSGGWVRRRQWVRLMMRPARSVSSVAGDDSSIKTSSPESAVMVWSGNIGVDWLHARPILKDLQTDGRHITIWRQWLSQTQLPLESSLLDHETPTTSSDLQPTTLAAAHDRDCARAVLEAHISDVLSFFVFPESRHLFLDMLASLQIIVDMADPDFYSLQPHNVNLQSSTHLRVP